MINTWDWPHSNNVAYQSNNVVRLGVCTSKSCMWLKKVLDAGGPLRNRRSYDGAAGGVGITPASFGAQAVHVNAARRYAQGNMTIDQLHRRIAQGHQLRLGPGKERGSAQGAVRHVQWLGRVFRKPGACLLTFQTPHWFHTVALWRASSRMGKSALFDSEHGQWSTVWKDRFRKEVLEFFNHHYLGVNYWVIYSAVVR